MHRCAVWLAVCLATHSYVVICSADERISSPPSKPLVAISGTDSHVKNESYERVETQGEWSNALARHLGTSVDDAYRPVIEVDFDKCFVIVVFRGDQIQVRQLIVDKLTEEKESITLRFSELGYQIGNSGPNPLPPEVQRPYAFVVLPKSDKPVRLLETIWNNKDSVNDFSTKEWARLTPRHPHAK